MFRFSQPALAAAVSLSVGAGLLGAPGAAFAADTGSAVTAQEMASAMTSAAAAAHQAGKSGWKSVSVFNAFGTAGSETAVYDAVNKRASLHEVYGDDEPWAGYAADGKGYYRTLDATDRATARMMGRPAARYAFEANSKYTIARDFTLLPNMAELDAEDVTFAGTKTVHDDGTVDYRFTDTTATTYVSHVSAAGALTGMDISGKGWTSTMTYTAAPQTVTLPAATAVISASALLKGSFYRTAPHDLSFVARDAASTAKKAAKGKNVSVKQVRTAAGKEAAAYNAFAGYPVVKVTSIKGGARVSTTNPWTKKTVAYTVKASGKKVTVKKK